MKTPIRITLGPWSNNVLRLCISAQVGVKTHQWAVLWDSSLKQQANTTVEQLLAWGHRQFLEMMERKGIKIYE